MYFQTEHSKLEFYKEISFMKSCSCCHWFNYFSIPKVLTSWTILPTVSCFVSYREMYNLPIFWKGTAVFRVNTIIPHLHQRWGTNVKCDLLRQRGSNRHPVSVYLVKKFLLCIREHQLLLLGSSRPLDAPLGLLAGLADHEAVVALSTGLVGPLGLRHLLPESNALPKTQAQSRGWGS